MMRTFFCAGGVALALLMLTAPAAGAAQCGDRDDPFAAYYGQQGIGKQWQVTMVTPDHEDHGLHLVEGDSFVLTADENCEVILVPGPTLSQRWGSDLQQLGRESTAVDPRTISNELCTTMSLGHKSSTTGNVVERPHLLRLSLSGDTVSPRLEIRYGHRSRMADSCSNDGLLDSVHGGVAHAED
jgi:hypothetical protein